MIHQDLLNLLRTTDSFAVIEKIQEVGSPQEIASEYQKLVSNLYWKARDLPAVITIGRAGIYYCLTQAMTATSAEPMDQLRSVAKSLAYDIGSFTWPGWEEPGIDPTPADLAVGMECARLNLRLAIELNKPKDRLSMAHWLIGAHALSIAELDLAEKQFQLAQEVLPIDDPAIKTLGPCNLGYLAIARLCKNGADQAAHADLNQILAELAARNSDDSRMYLSQLQSAHRIFVPG